jgi:DNA mismatch repair ATPase MutS
MIRIGIVGIGFMGMSHYLGARRLQGVARLAGIPGEVLDRAKQVLAELETHHLDKELPRPSRRRRRPQTEERQPNLFADLQSGTEA